VKGGEQSVIVACGGFTGGYSLFVKNDRLYYDYNFLDGTRARPAGCARERQRLAPP